jgi:DNA-binding Xre family transcriptional regulator
MSRSLRVRADLVPQVELAVKRNGFPRKKDLAEALEMAESTVRNFRTGKPVDHAIFVEICQKLNLEWRDFADLGEITEPHRESEEAVIARYSDSEAEKTKSAPPGLAESEEAIAKPHRESTEAVDASVRELNPKTGVDYDRLRNLLAIGKWREADEETRSLILCLVCREIEGSLRARDINKLPSQDLQTIDKLWVKYSGGRFGFSVQKRLWQDVVGSRSNPGYGTLRRFGERVGWYVKGSWLSWSNLSFSVDSAPIGYLPTTSFIIYGNRLLNSAASLESFFEVEAEHGSGLNVSLFFSRVETCKL